MSETAHRNMNDHTNKITNLKNKFNQIVKERNNNGVDKEASEVLRDMRKIHGCAIYDDFADIMEIMSKGPANANDDDWIKLSVNSSLLHIMHSYIRHCEKFAHNQKRGNAMASLITTDSDKNSDSPKEFNQEQNQPDSSKSSFSNAMSKNRSTSRSNNRSNSRSMDESTNSKPVVRRISNDTEELSIQNMGSDTSEYQSKSENLPALSSIFSKSNGQSGGENSTQQQTANTTDYIDNLTSTEAARLASEYEKTHQQSKSANSTGKSTANSMTNSTGSTTQEFDSDKPTLIYYWSDQCGFSLKFNPTWKEFKEKAKEKFPKLQVASLNVKQDEELNKMAKSVGVEGYPTIVLFYDKNIYPKVSTKMSVEDIDEFVKETIKNDK